MEELASLSEKLAEKLLERRRSVPREVLRECDAAVSRLFEALDGVVRAQEAYTGVRLTEGDRGFATLVLAHTVLFLLDRFFSWYDKGLEWRDAVGAAYDEVFTLPALLAFNVELNAWLKMMRMAEEGEQRGG